jgi:hypothetical protein
MAQTKALSTANRTAAVDPDSELAAGLLLAESEEGRYEPVSAVSTINEAIEIAQGNFQHRLNELDRGGAPMCPERYVVWASSREGDYEIVSEIEPA